MSCRAILHEAEPRYQFPSRNTLSKDVIPQLYIAEKANLQEELKQVIAVAITSDGWTSRATQSYETYTCHYINNWQLCSKVLQTNLFTESHTGDNLGTEMARVLEEWGIKEKTKVLTVDNAANMGIAARVAGIELKMGCFAHTLNLAANKSLGVKSDSLLKALAKIRSTVTYFHKSTTASEQLKKMQAAFDIPQNRLIMDVRTRWNSTHDMCARFSEQKRAVIAALSSDQVKHKPQTSAITDDDIEIAEEYVVVMKPLACATYAMSSENSPTMGTVLPALAKLKKDFTVTQTDSENVRLIKHAVWGNLETRYTNPQLVMFLEESSAMDPRMKCTVAVTSDVWARVSRRCEESASDAQVNWTIFIQLFLIEISQGLCGINIYK